MEDLKRQGYAMQSQYFEEKVYRIRAQKPEKLFRVQDEISAIEREAVELER